MNQSDEQVVVSVPAHHDPTAGIAIDSLEQFTRNPRSFS